VIVIGLDPGTTTGLAVWDTIERKLRVVKSCGIVTAMDDVAMWRDHGDRSALVIFEDARTLRVTGGRMEEEQKKYGAAVREGVGSIKRDCAIWEEFLEVLGLPYQCKKWTRGTTKWDADYFKRITGWEAKTNSHARDAAVIVFGLNQPICAGIVRAWEEDQQRKKRSTGKSSAAQSTSASATLRPFRTAGAG